VRLREKGGKRHEMPAHHKLEHFIIDRLASCRLSEASSTTSHVVRSWRLAAV
jgi:hypothetical protein